MAWIFDNVLFPYPNMQQLNLDWIMEKIKSIEDEIKSLEGMVDPGYIEGEIGQLQEQVNVLKYFQRFYKSAEKGWNVFINKDGFVCASIGVTFTVTSVTTVGNGWYSQKLYYQLPLPLDPATTISAVCDRRGAWVSNLDGYRNSGFTFYVFYPQSITTPASVNVRFNIISKIAIAPAAITTSHNDTYGQQIVDIAQTYIDAVDGGRKFSYGDNFFFSSSSVVNDSIGYGKLECDAFVDLCLRAIPYDKSPYVVTDPNFTYDYDDLYLDVSGATTWAPSTAYALGDLVLYSGVAEYWRCTEAHTSGADFDPSKWSPIWLENPNGYSWVSSIGLHPTNSYSGRDIRIAGDYDFLGWQKQSICSDLSKAKTGDVAIWVRRIHEKTDYGFNESNYFDNVGHVAIISIEAGIPWLYEVTSASLSGGRVVNKRRMDSGVPPTYFARFV